MYKVLLFLFVLILLQSCESTECVDHPAIESVDIKVIRLENDFKLVKSTDDINTFLNSHLDLKNNFLLGLQYPDSFIVDYLYRVNNSPGADTIYSECESTFNDFTFWKEQFGQSFALLQNYFPEEKPRTINTFISGLTRDLFVNDTSVFVGIDYFLGPKATFRPQNYQYVLKRYTPETVAPMTFMYISGKYNESDMKSNTLLSEMIYYGKSYYFTKQMLPCVADSLIIGFSKEEAEGSEDNMKRVWSHFVENELLYITNEREKQRYIGERPNVTEIGNKCPGRIGQWLGWQIVNAYMAKNPEVSLKQLMASTDAKGIFEKSKFRP